MNADTTLHRLWDHGQSHLAAGRYAAARAALEQASDLATRTRDLQSLARLYLPLLEVRRLMRYRAAEGRILILDPHHAQAAHNMRDFLHAKEGTVLIISTEYLPAAKTARQVDMTRRRAGTALEALLLLQHRTGTRIASPAAPTFAGGINCTQTAQVTPVPSQTTDPTLRLPLPPPGRYDGKSGLGAMARESLLLAWEALALRWQSQHPLPPRAGPWDELLWLRAALHIDPACEPVTMRLIALAEGLQRQS